MEFEITDNSGPVKEELEAAVLRALESCGRTAEGYAKLLCPVDTGRLRSSIAHRVQEREQAVSIGSDVPYAAHVELGAAGRPCRDAKGRWHPGRGQRAQPYLKPAVADHAPVFRSIIEEELHG